MRFKVYRIADSLDISKEKSASLALLSTISLKCKECHKVEKTAVEALAIDDIKPGNTLSLYENLAKVYAKLVDSNKANKNKLNHRMSYLIKVRL